jgi:hypothetical protein
VAISFVGSMAPVGVNNGGNVTLTFTGASGLLNAAGAQATLAQGDVVVCVYASSGTADAAMSTSSSGWTEVHEGYANGTSNDTNLALYYKVMGGTPDTSFVGVGPTGSSNGTIGTAFAFRGMDASVLDVTFVAGSHFATGTASTRPNAPSITPVTAGAWILVAGAGAAAAGSAFTNPGDLSATTNHFRSSNHAEAIDIAVGVGLKTDWASGAFDPAAWTGGAANAGDSWAAIVIALKPQGSTAYEPTVTPAALPITGSTVTPVYGRVASVTAASLPIAGATVTPSLARSVTVTPAALPITGATVSPVFNKSPSVTPAALPIAGATVAPVFNTNVSVTPAALPIAGSTVAPVFGKTVTVTPAALPIVGQTIQPQRTWTASVTPAALPIAGATITPVHAEAAAERQYPRASFPVYVNENGVRQSIVFTTYLVETAAAASGTEYTVTVTPAALPIVGQAVVPVFARTVPVTPASLPIAGQTVAPTLALSASITPAALPIAGATVIPVHFTGAVAPTQRGGGNQGDHRRSKRVKDPRSAIERLLDHFRAAQAAIVTPEAPTPAPVKTALTAARRAPEGDLLVPPSSPALAVEWDQVVAEMARQDADKQALVARALETLQAIEQAHEEDEEDIMLLLTAA